MRPPAAPSAPPRAEAEPERLVSGAPCRSPGPRRAAGLQRAAPVLAIAIAACAPALPPPDPQAEREAVLAAVDRLWDAYSHQDLPALERLYAPEAVQIARRRLEGREAILRYLRDYYRGLQVQGWARTQTQVTLAGDLALVSYWLEETGLSEGVPYRAAGWVSDVWIRRDGSWLNLLTHFGTDQTHPSGEGAE